MKVLNHKVAIVTGASSGIGRATAKLFAEAGAQLVITGRREDALEEVCAEIKDQGGDCRSVAGDVKSETVAKKLAQTALEQFGGLDIAVNCAGVLGPMQPTTDVSLSDWQETLDVNLTGAFLCAKYQVPLMLKRGSGSVIFVSSFVGHTVGFPGTSAYAASKAGLVGLTQVMAAELGASGIRVNALLPGGTDTPANHANLPGADPGTRSFIEGLHALKRLARPQEIAHSALHLASDASSFITGTALLVDGGVSISRT